MISFTNDSIDGDVKNESFINVSQLLNLNEQTVLSFEVIIPDPHYSKRNWLKEFTKYLKYNIVHFGLVFPIHLTYILNLDS